MRCLSLSLMVLWMATSLALGASPVRVTQLRCEYAENPLGIETPAPRLFWIMESSKRGQRQTAYQILVAASEAKLKANLGDLWDTGKMRSDQSIQIPYAGKPLVARQRCWWKVRIWDRDGNLSEYSPAAFWEMGLLQPEDWRASWISLPYHAPGDSAWEKARWIWFPSDTSASNAPPRQCFFRRVFDLPAGRRIKRAQMRLAADVWFELHVNGKFIGKNSGKPYAWKFLNEMEITEWLRPGANVLCVAATNRETTAGLLGQLVVEFDQGPAMTLQTDSSWKSALVVERDWKTVRYEDAAWTSAQELAKPGDAPWSIANYPPLGPCPYFRHTAHVPKPVKSARLYASALGVYEFYINGQRVGNDLFNPGWTDYHRRVQYHTYDVTRLLKRGDNGLGIILGDGWYAGFVGLGGRARYGKTPMALAQLEIEFTDGTRQTIGTDDNWLGHFGPLRQSDMLMGETYDAQLEMLGWNQSGFGAAGWQAVTAEKNTRNLVAAGDPPVRQTQALKPIAITCPVTGRFVFDLGQNMVGWARLKVKGQPGTRVQLRFGEMLNPDGTLYTDNLREAKCTDVYILKGDGVEVYEPHFTFHGFRYVEVAGLPGAPNRDTITGIVIHSDLPVTGKFECSNPFINKLQSNIVWGQRGNFLSIPTDCPQRDERLGWTGDAQVFIRTASYNMEVARFFTKWMQDVLDAQRPDGAFTDVAPDVAATNGTPAWGDAGVICPWTLYQVYGDKRILEKCYPAAVRWIEYLQANSTNLLRPARGYSDWLSIDADTPKDVLATAYFAHSTRLVAEMAEVLGKKTDADKFHALDRRIDQAFNEAYVSPNGRIKGDTQTGYLMALQFGLAGTKSDRALKYLVEDIEAKKNHLSTGFIGVGMLLPVLTDQDRVDVAYRLLNQDTFPSWLHSIKQGATTIWERWDGWTQEKGFQTPWMNSFNHYSLGSVGTWLFSSVGGIAASDSNPNYGRPGFDLIYIKPHPGGGLNWAKAEYDSIHGKIRSGWRIINGDLALKVTIPVNTEAVIDMRGSPMTVMTDGKLAMKSPDIRYVGYWREKTRIVIGSGTYHFRIVRCSQEEEIARCLAMLNDRIQDPTHSEETAATRVLGQIGEPALKPVLPLLLSDNPDTQSRAIITIKIILVKMFGSDIYTIEKDARRDEAYRFIDSMGGGFALNGTKEQRIQFYQNLSQWLDQREKGIHRSATH